MHSQNIELTEVDRRAWLHFLKKKTDLYVSGEGNLYVSSYVRLHSVDI